MAGAEGVYRRDRLGGAELEAAAIHLVHHRRANRQGGGRITHQAVVGGQPEVDAGPYLQGVGAIGIERRAIAPQAIGHPQPTAGKGFKTGLFYCPQRRAAALIAHHRWQTQQPRIKVAAELVGHHHRRAAFGIDVVVLAIPEQAIEVGAAQLQPATKLALLPAGIQPQLQLQPLAHGQARLQGGDPQGAAVGAHPPQRPVVEGLIRGAAVVGQPVAVDIKIVQIAQGGHRRRPAVGQEAQILAAGGQPETAPHLQHKITGQVFPEVAILIGGVVGGVEGTLVGGPQVVGGGPGQLAGGLDAAAPLGEIPADRPGRGVAGRNRPGEAAQYGLVQFRPELQQAKGAVKPHVEAFVPGVVEALQHPEAAHGIAGARGGPEAAAAGQVVELVEQGHPQRFGQVGALQHRPLPAIDLLAPTGPIRQRLGGYGGGVVAAGPEEIRVAPQGATAAGKAGLGQIPADHQGDLNAGAGLQPQPQGQGGTGWIPVAAGAIVIAVRN